MLYADEAQLDSELLGGLCHAFGSAADFDELAASTSRWGREALGTSATVRFALPDRSGRLRIAWKNGETSEVGRKRSARRREAFRSKRPQRLSLRGADGRAMALFPLVSRGEVFGVLEISADGKAVDGRWAFLEALASQAAIAQRNLIDRARLRHEVEAMGRAASFGLELVQSHDPLAAVRVAVRFLAERVEAPVAGWTTPSGADRMELVAVRGLGSRKRREVRGEMGGIDRWSKLGAREREQVTRRFADLVGARDVAVVDAGEAVLLVATADLADASADVVASALSGVLQHLAVTELAERRNSQLDLGLAWTAHELRAPVLSVKAALELMLRSEHETEIGRLMMRRSLRELELLAGTTEGLLGWSVGARPLRRRSVDVAALVSEVAETLSEDPNGDLIKVTAPGPAFASVDAAHLRGAITNILRNAIAYSAPGREVRVTVEQLEDRITVSVKNRGSFIPETERTSIFDPFVRGSLGRAQSGSTGLGLFIARRVVEAHGGEIWVESNRRQSTFGLQLPTGTARARRSAS